jgi:hypothetical protein
MPIANEHITENSKLAGSRDKSWNFQSVNVFRDGARGASRGNPLLSPAPFPACRKTLVFRRPAHQPLTDSLPCYTFSGRYAKNPILGLPQQLE